ncbi:MAG TPA: helix-turn-helix transcriptional regulator [Ktedonobacterales bacterium]|jgi:transcriptional regulator with XRE-family HTH domain|nr:helix-turn-helix transcriptional regulator [Ktedonobacterales bacterium]
MPRLDELKVSDSPFARVLTAFMWSKTPPWSASKVAAVLGIQRARVAKWVYGDTTPELDTVLVVMAKLGIPVRFLIDAYAASGIPVPPLDVDEAQVAAAEQQRVDTLGPAASAYYGVPAARRGRGGGIGRRTGVGTGAGESAPVESAPQTHSTQPTQQEQPSPRPAPAPRTASTTAATAQPPTGQQAQPYDDQTPDIERGGERPQGQSGQGEETWDKMVAHTRKVMGMAGMPAAALEAMLAEIENARDKEPNRGPKTSGAQVSTSQQPRHKSEPAR